MIAKQFVKPTEPRKFEGQGEAWFETDADEMYPAMIGHIQDLLALPAKRSNTESERFYLQLASKLPGDAWINALRDKGIDGLSNNQVLARAKALEIARKFFTAKLREEQGEVMGLRIVGGEKWKLHVQVHV